MYALITVLIIIACALLIIIVLIQNPKGGGLSQSFGGMGNQILGVKRTTDFLEKATWTLAGTLVALSLLTFFFVGTATTTTGGANTNTESKALENPDLSQPQAAPLPGGGGTDSTGGRLGQ